MKMVETNGATLATEAFGTSENGDILLVMGATASMVAWPETFCRRLAAAGYRVIRFDHRDTGRSTTNPPGVVAYDVSDLASDVLAIMDAYGLAACHLVGMSLGALIGQVLALEAPQRLRSLTLISAEPLGMPYEGEGISPAFMSHFGSMASLDWSDRDAVIGFLLRIAELSAGSAFPFDAKAARAEIERVLSRTASIQSAFNHSMIAGQIDPALRADAIAVPTLVIHGTEDPVISPNAARTSAAAIAGARLLLLEGRGHELAAPDLDHIADAILALAGARSVS